MQVTAVLISFSKAYVILIVSWALIKTDFYYIFSKWQQKDNNVENQDTQKW